MEINRMLKVCILAFCSVIFACGIVAANGADLEAGMYELKKGDFSIKVTNYGARIVSVFLPDRNGKLGDVALGFDTVEEYMSARNSFGAIVGRVAGRISGAKFTINGTVYHLDPNGKGGNFTIHGGRNGFAQVIWKVEKLQQSGPSPYITFSYHSPDGDQGFPGDVIVYATYALAAPYRLILKMNAKALNKPTPVNLAPHTYWNLGGHDSGDILSDKLQIFASRYTPVDRQIIPTGEIVSVKDTPYDFLAPHKIGSQLKKLPNGTNGYDINYALDGYNTGQKIWPVAEVYSEKSGRVMNLWANTPGVGLYTANTLNVTGKNGYHYQPYAALTLETQGFPDSVNQPSFPSQIVSPGNIYDHLELYSFSTKK